MSDLKNKFISVKEYNSVQEYKDEQVKEEIIEILNFTEKEAFDLEKKGFFFIPNKIIYIRRTDNFENIIKNLTKNKQKKIRKSIKNIQDLELIKENPVKKETFRGWYKEVYIPFIKSKGLGIIIVDENWCSKNLTKHKTYGIFFKKKGEIIAGIVGKNYKKDDYLPKRLSISLSAIKEEFKHLGINDYLNILMINFAYEQGYTYISRGKDTNLYGKHLSSGIPIFKTSLGYEILPYKKIPNILIKFNNLNNFNNPIFFVSYTKNSDKLIANLILKEDIKNINDYNKEFFLKLRVFKYEDKKIREIN